MRNNYLILRLILFLVTTILSSIIVTKASAEIFLMLHQEASVIGEKITIGDVCVITGAGQKEKHYLQDIPIGQSPNIGQTRTIKKNYIRMRLKQNRINLSSIKIKGSPIVTITRASQTISKDMLRQKVQDYIAMLANKEKITCTIEELNIRAPDEFLLPLGDLELSFNMPSSQLKPSLGFYVLCLINGNKEQTFWTTARLELEKEVITAKDRIKRWQVIASEDIERKRITLTNSNYDSYYTHEDMVIGKRARTNIEAHMIINPSQVEATPLVTKGDKVRIVLENEKLRIVSMGEATENGFAGERVRVKNISSQKELIGMLQDKNTVLIEY